VAAWDVVRSGSLTLAVQSQRSSNEHRSVTKSRPDGNRPVALQVATPTCMVGSGSLTLAVQS
jgi:hypothetical protein